MNEVLTARVILDTYWLNLFLAVVLPMVTALVTKRVAPSWVKSVVLILLTVVASTVQTWVQAGGEFEVQATILNFVITFVTAVATHFGFLKPAQVTGTDGAIAKAIPAGIGPSTPVQFRDAA